MSEMIVEKVRIFLEDLLPTFGLELFDIQFRMEGHGWVLRVFVDSENGVTLDDCSNVSRELGLYLDVEDVIDHAYNLEISSPGLERPLRSYADFERYLGRKAKLKFHDALEGEKIHVGIIEKIEDGVIFLRNEDGRDVSFTCEMLNKARLSL